MFSFAILIGIYSYLIFGIGLLGLLYRQAILSLTIVFFIFLIVLFKKQINHSTKFFTRSILAKGIQGYSLHKLLFLFLFLLLIQAVVNLVGGLGPELGFDALWYHLTLPKLYVQNHNILHIPGSLLYYSGMPKLTEMLYTSSLFFGNEIIAKLIHFSFGLLSCLALYFLSRKFFNKKLSIVAVIIFYSNLVVGWQSTTAYIDLVRVFFEVMALWAFINFVDKDTPYQPRTRSILAKRMWLTESAVMLGLAISTKLLAIGSLFIFVALIMYRFYLKNKKDRDFKSLITNILVYLCISLLIPLPWFIFSFVHTGNPIFPLFSSLVKTGYNINVLNPFNFLKEAWNLLISSADPISPLYLIFFPLIFIYFRKFSKTLKFIGLYSLFAIFVWYLTPRTGGGRFILPYLPAFSILAVQVIQIFEKKTEYRRLFVFLIIFISLSSIIYRGAANTKFIPVIFGKESKSHFLLSHLNFSFGDFYDTDGYFSRNIKNSDKVLLYGFHNLYYVNFPFIDSSWVKKNDTFNYIATQNSNLPKRFSNWNLIYYNSKTHVNLYSLGEMKWSY